MQPQTQFLATGRHPTTQRETSALLDTCRSKILSLQPQTKMQTNELAIFNMAQDKALAIMEKVQREKPAGKTPMLDALAKAYSDEEKAKEHKPAASTRPAPARPPAPPAASRTPHSDKLARLQGTDRASYYRANQKDILRESRI